jgi:hypothetical protein
MPHTCPDGYIPLGDAYGKALSVLEEHEALVRLIEEARTSEESQQSFHNYDVVGRRVERRMRDALADGSLPTFIRTPHNTMERPIEREPWRQEAFGIPNIDNVADPVTNPGVETGGQPVFVKIEDFEAWLTAERHVLNPFRTGGPGKPSAIRLVELEHERRLKAGKAMTKVSQEAVHLKEWLDRMYPDAPQTTTRTIENRIREAHRRHSAGARIPNP